MQPRLSDAKCQLRNVNSWLHSVISIGYPGAPCESCVIPSPIGAKLERLKQGDRNLLNLQTESMPPARRRRWWLAFLSASIFLLLADGAYSFFRMGMLLRQTGARFQSALDAFEDARFAAARTELQGALEAARSASGYARHPGAVGVSVAPLVGNDADALQAMSDASELAAKAGLRGVQAASALGVAPGGFPAAVYRDGRVRFEAIQAVGPMVSGVDQLLDEASTKLQNAPEPRFAFIANPLATAQDRISDAGRSAHKASVLFGSLPNLLAQDARHQYLLLFQALGEARGTGGVAGIWGVLEASDGRLRLRDLAPVAELQPRPIPAVDAPDWFKRSYGPFFALRQWSQANLSPNFPVVSEVFLQMYEAARGRTLDGVIAVDPVALEDLIPATGSLQARGLDVEVGAHNAAKVLMRDAYIDTSSPEAQNAYLEAIVRQFWHRIYAGEVDAVDLGKGLGNAATTQHFKAYAIDDEDQEALRELEVDGTFGAGGPNVQMVFHNNAGLNKFDYYLRRTTSTSIEIKTTGTALVRTSIFLENRAPLNIGDALGPGVSGDVLGLNAMYLNLLMPHGARLQSFFVNGRSRRPFRINEDGFPVAWDLMEIPAGDTAVVRVTYKVPAAVDLSEGGGLFKYTLWPQTSAFPERYSFEVKLPEGYEATQVEGTRVPGDGFVTGSGQLDRPTSVTVELTKP